jgi:hypothetical protein
LSARTKANTFSISEKEPAGDADREFYQKNGKKVCRAKFNSAENREIDFQKPDAG